LWWRREGGGETLSKSVSVKSEILGPSFIYILIHYFYFREILSFREGVLSVSWKGGHFTKNRQKSSSFIRVQMYPPRRPRWRGEGQGPIARVRALGRSHVRGYDGRLDKKSSRDECNNDRNARCDRLQQCSRCGRHTRGPQGKGGEREAKTRSHCEVRSPAVVLPFPLPLSPLPPGPVC
jgi:hypothetical protein